MRVKKVLFKIWNAWLNSDVLRVIDGVLIFAFLFNAILLPSDPFGFKILSLIFLLVLNVPVILDIRDDFDYFLVRFGVIWTTFTIWSSYVLTGELYQNVAIGYPGYIMLLYPIIRHIGMDIERYISSILKIIIVFLLLMALLDITTILPMENNAIFNWLHTSENAFVGKGEHLPLRYMIFLKTSPLFFILLFYSIQKQDYVFLVASVIMLILSGTRAILGMLVVGGLGYVFLVLPDKKSRLYYLGALCLLAVILIIDNGLIFKSVLDMFNRKQGSDDVRTGHLLGLFEYWKNDPSKFFIGGGYSSEFYSYGADGYVYNIELSYWNLLRQVGIIPFLCLMGAYALPIWSLYKQKKYYVIFPYVIYLVIAYTNPFLYSSTALVIVLYVYRMAFKKPESENKILKEKIKEFMHSTPLKALQL